MRAGIRTTLVLCAGILGLGLLVPGTGAAQQVDTLGRSQDWTAYTMTENGQKVCYVASQPKKDEGNYDQRGEIYTLITHRPQNNEFYVVTVYAGYPYKEGSSVSLSVDNKKTFPLFTHGESAWALDEHDRKIVDAMKAGTEMVIKGTSSRGTATTDTYSLLGVTAALNTIDKACNAR